MDTQETFRERYDLSIYAQNIKSAYVKSGEAAIFYMGQAGFIIKTDEQKYIALDLYLSDCCNRYFGFKRLSPYIIEAHDIEFDYLLASHSHYDHFDVDSVPIMMSEKTKFIGAIDTKAECERLGIIKNTSFIKCGDTVSLGNNVNVKAVECDHGTLAPDAVGFLITIGEKKIYYMGDTAYREDFLKNAELKNADLLLAPINGEFGNMNSSEAAQAAKTIGAKLTVPYHFWTFAEHGGNPHEFKKIMEEEKLNFMLLRMGEGIVI